MTFIRRVLKFSLFVSPWNFLVSSKNIGPIRTLEKKQGRLPLTKNLLGSDAVLSKSSSLLIRLSRSSITSVATSQKVNAYNNKTGQQNSQTEKVPVSLT